MERRIVLSVPKEKAVIKEENGRIYLMADRENVDVFDEYEFRYFQKQNDNPPIPKDYEQVAMKKGNLFVIERKWDHSRFCWIPLLKPIWDRKLESEEYRHKFQVWCRSEDPWNDEFEEQMEKIKCNRGFYLSCYAISVYKWLMQYLKKECGGKPIKDENLLYQSVPNGEPISNVNFAEAMRKAAFVGERKMQTAESHLPYGLECDCLVEYYMNADLETKEALAEFYGGKVIWTQECGPEGRRIMRSEEKGVPFAHRYDTTPMYSAKRLQFFAALSL